MLSKKIWDTLSKVDVSAYVEKKGNLTYLSWAWAWRVLMEHFPDVQYEFDVEKFDDGTVEVRVAVSISEEGQDVVRHMWLPVMDYKNKAIQNPDSFAINTAKMRCLTKCLAMFGLGHYIYAGEDIPSAKANESIDQDQCAVIYDLLEKTGSDIEKFLKAFKIDSVEAMPSNAFDKAFGLLQRKMKSADK